MQGKFEEALGLLNDIIGENVVSEFHSLFPILLLRVFILFYLSATKLALSKRK